jgi:hypothetical protein
MKHPATDSNSHWHSIDMLLEEIAGMQRKKLLSLARRIVPTATPEDILQPNDYPELESHPEFRYEEGLLAGVQTAQMALRAQGKISSP